MAAAPHQRPLVLSLYRQFLRLARRLPPERATAAAGEARATLRARAGETDPQKALDGARELAARVAFLRMTTPRPPGEPLDAGRFVWREGAWREGEGESKGTRCAGGGVSGLQPRRCRARRGGGATAGQRWAACFMRHAVAAAVPVCWPPPPPGAPTPLPLPRCRRARSVADGSISVEEAKQRNAAHYERFYGKAMPKKMFF
jgi:hypothetical protein